jgi:hypothetical protein
MQEKHAKSFVQNVHESGQNAQKQKKTRKNRKKKPEAGCG